MPVNTTYNIRIEKQVRDQADILYRNMGLTLSSAINLFLRQSIIQGKLPINEIVAESYYTNALLQDAAEVDEFIKNGTAKLFATPNDLFASWEVEK